jgi:hypothetical protein
MNAAVRGLLYSLAPFQAVRNRDCLEARRKHDCNDRTLSIFSLIAIQAVLGRMQHAEVRHQPLQSHSLSLSSVQLAEPGRVPVSLTRECFSPVLRLKVILCGMWIAPAPRFRLMHEPLDNQIALLIAPE